MKAKTLLLVIFLFVLVVIYSFATINTDTEKQNVSCLALVDGSISSKVQYDLSRKWSNHNDPLNFKDDDANGLVDDTSGWNFRDDNNEVFVSDGSNHGTSLMFLLNGIAPGYCNLLYNTECSILPIKILSNDEGARMADLIDAIKYAEDMGARVCNLSITTSEKNRKLYETMKHSNLLFVVSAGNGGKRLDNSNTAFPAMYDLDNILTVGATDASNKLSRFSNYSTKYVDVLTCGENILSKNSYNEWEYYSGTTYATVRVSALAMKGIEEGAATPAEIKQYVINKSHYQNSLKNYVKYGVVE